MCDFFSYFVQMSPTLYYNFAYRTLQFKQHYTCDVNIQFNNTPMWYCLNKPFLIKVEEAFNLSLCHSYVFKSCFSKLFSFATTQQTSGVGCQCWASKCFYLLCNTDQPSCKLAVGKMIFNLVDSLKCWMMSMNFKIRNTEQTKAVKNLIYLLYSDILSTNIKRKCIC